MAEVSGSQIGFIGLGAMGLPMARNLVGRGHRVRGFDIRPGAVDALVAAGGEAAGSTAEAANGAAILILMVVSAGQAEAVLFGDGALDALAPDAVVVLMATCSPGSVERLAERVAATGRRFLDAPVSGGTIGAAGGTLTVMAAGAAATFAAVEPVLLALGDKLFHVGEKPGQGAVVKTVNQLLCGVHIAVAAEALALAGKVGIDRARMLEILGGSAASSWMLTNRGPRMLESEPDVMSAVDIFVKDLGIVLEAGRDTKAALPFAALAHQLFLGTSGHGEGGLDDSQVIRAYQRLNGG